MRKAKEKPEWPLLVSAGCVVVRIYKSRNREGEPFQVAYPMASNWSKK